MNRRRVVKVRSILGRGWRTVAYIIGSYRQSSRYLLRGWSGIRCLFVGSLLVFVATVGVGVLSFAAPLPLVPEPPLLGVLPLVYFVVFELLLAPVYGFLFRVIRETMKLDPNPPWFEDWTGLVRLGLKGSIVTLVLLDVPFHYPELAIDVIGRLIPLPFGLGNFYSVILFSAIFVYPAALVSVAETGRIRDVLAIRRFKQLLTNWNYVIIAAPMLAIVMIRTFLVEMELAVWKMAINPGRIESQFGVQTSVNELVLYGVITVLWVSPLVFYLLVTTYRVVGSHWLAVTGSERPFDPLNQLTFDDIE